MENDEVLVFPAKILQPYKFLNLQAYTPAYKNLLSDIRSASVFVPQEEAENDTSVLQIVTYSYVYGWKPEILVYRRTDESLQRKLSIGVGGSVKPEDNQGEQLFKISALNRMNESIRFSGATRKNTDPSRSAPDILDFTLRGFIRKPADTHFGIVYSFSAPGDMVTSASPKFEAVGWSRLGDLNSPLIFVRLEDWSQDLLTFLMR